MSLQKLLVCQLTVFLSAFTGASDGYYFGRIAKCLFTSPDRDIVAIDNYIFNKDVFIQFNSTVGEFVGYTELGVKNAEAWNKDPNRLAQERAEVDRVCKNNVKNDYDNVLVKAVKPRVKLNSLKQAGGRHPAVLMCSAYDFYPKQIKVSWLRDGKPVTSEVISSEELADGNWYYQIHSHLEYTPKSGEKISCMVEHGSFKQPMIYDWDPSLPESERNKIVIGASGLVLGIIITAAGLIYYKKKSAGRILVPH
ncbi:rano class II histocompatibility antigen, A beta chain [Paramisgurnus dabryanus]|uniref:rano class II histocompatibility antigen, A beta chain n=1 Tax=Paramisgurnus dabryanus TaxID=90735 RepID=UPI0031F39DE1